MESFGCFWRADLGFMVAVSGGFCGVVGRLLVGIWGSFVWDFVASLWCNLGSKMDLFWVHFGWGLGSDFWSVFGGSVGGKGFWMAFLVGLRGVLDHVWGCWCG